MKLRTALRTFASRSWAARTDCSRSGFKPRDAKAAVAREIKQ